MIDASRILVLASTAVILIAFVLYLVEFASGRARLHEDRRGGAGSSATRTPVATTAVGTAASWATIASFAMLTLAMVLRMVAVGHPPLSNGYEFAVSFAWAVLLAYLVFELRYKMRGLSLFVLPVAIAMILYAVFKFPSEPQSLLPALQNGPLLFLHVITATISYGAGAVGGAAGILYLLQPRLADRLPDREKIEEIGYRAVVLSYPLMTLAIILGAVWADVAWGRYWSWDPKETTSLLTWLVYGGYLHARVMRDWRGKRSAIMLIIGFAAILFTFFGNMFLGGLHSYGS